MPPSPNPPSAIPPAAVHLLDTPAEAVFDRFTRLASQLLGVPVSLISILDTDRQFFKSALGLPEPFAQARETPLSHSFCQHVVRNGAPLVVTNAHEDERVRENLAVADLGVIAYAGFPILDPQGTPIGALCAIDGQPRRWTPSELEALKTVAQLVTSEIATQEKLIQMGVNLAELRAAEKAHHLMSRADRHDLRTPLNALMLNLQALPQFGPLNEDQHEFLTSAKASMKTVLEMVDRMIDIGNVDSRGQNALEQVPLDSRELLRQAVDQVQPLAEAKGIELQCAEQSCGQCFADADKMLRVLVNLLTNGVKFTPRGGSVTATVAPAEEDGRSAIRFTVEDTGIGVAAQHIGRLFEEGFRVDPGAPTSRSTGLGLTFCKRIVEAHGGRIWVESVEHQGSEFHFTVPRV